MSDILAALERTVEQARAEPRITIPASREAVEAYWQAYAEIGPRHAAIARWRHRYGWTISNSFARGWLAPEMGTP